MKAALPGMKRARLGPHHQHRLGARPGRERAEGRLRRRQARRRRADQGGGARDWPTTASPCNAICPGWVLTPLVQKQIDDRARAARASRSSRRSSDLLAREAADGANSPRRSRSARWRCSCARTARSDDHRRAAVDRRRLGGAVDLVSGDGRVADRTMSRRPLDLPR